MFSFSPKTDGNKSQLPLIVDGESVDEQVGYVKRSDDKDYALVLDFDIAEKALLKKPHKIIGNLDEVYLSLHKQLSKEFEEFYLSDIFILKKASKFSFHFDFGFELDNWKAGWTVIEHVQKFFEYVAEIDETLVLKKTLIDDDGHFDWSNLNWLEFGLVSEFTDEEIQQFNPIQKKLDVFRTAHDKTLVSLSQKAASEILLQKFSFPEEIRVACEQYLLYFTDFLRDIGIEAQASLMEKYGDVLFSVEPKNKDEALENIQIALEIYLRLPSVPALNTAQPINLDLAVQRLGAQINFLQSQLTLANATIQQKDFLINQQSEFIQHQQITAKILIDSRTEDTEPVIGKLITIKEFDWGPLSLGLPELLRWMKKKFKGT